PFPRRRTPPVVSRSGTSSRATCAIASSCRRCGPMSRPFAASPAMAGSPLDRVAAPCLQASSSVYVRFLALVVLAMTASGCAALALPAIGTSVMGNAAGGAAKAGVERTMRGAMRQSFRDREIQISEDDLLIGGGAKIKGEALHRHITVRLEPVTPALTRLKLVVRHGLFGRDPATASELIEQTVRALEEIRPDGAAFPRAP